LLDGKDSEETGNDRRHLSQPCRIAITLEISWFHLEPWIFLPIYDNHILVRYWSFGNTDSLSYAYFPKFVTFHYTVWKKSHSLISSPISSERSWTIAKLPSSQWQIGVFQNSAIYWKAQISSLAKNSVNFFLEDSLFIFKKMSAKYPNLSNCSSLIILSNRSISPWKRVTNSAYN